MAPWWIVVLEEAPKYRLLPWEFVAQCSKLWWERTLEYQKVSKKRYGKIPDWAFLIMKAIEYEVPPWELEKSITSEWWHRELAYHNALQKHSKKMQSRNKNLAVLSKIMK